MDCSEVLGRPGRQYAAQHTISVRTERHPNQTVQAIRRTARLPQCSSDAGTPDGDDAHDHVGRGTCDDECRAEVQRSSTTATRETGRNAAGPDAAAATGRDQDRGRSAGDQGQKQCSDTGHAFGAARAARRHHRTRAGRGHLASFTTAFRIPTGNGFDALTAAEARNQARLDAPERIRDRIVAGVVERSAGLDEGTAGQALASRAQGGQRPTRTRAKPSANPADLEAVQGLNDALVSYGLGAQ